MFQAARKAIHAMAISAAVGERRSLKGGRWGSLACGSIVDDDAGDNKRTDVSPRGLLCFSWLFFSPILGRSFLFPPAFPLFPSEDRHRGSFVETNRIFEEQTTRAVLTSRRLPPMR